MNIYSIPLKRLWSLIILVLNIDSKHKIYGGIIMPREDKTGPNGKGPMTGKGLGKCNPDNKSTTTDTSNFGKRNGMGRKLCGRFRNNTQ